MEDSGCSKKPVVTKYCQKNLNSNTLTGTKSFDQTLILTFIN